MWKCDVCGATQPKNCTCGKQTKQSGCAEGNHGPWTMTRNPVVLTCDHCGITPLGAYEQARQTIAELRAKKVDVEGLAEKVWVALQTSPMGRWDSYECTLDIDGSDAIAAILSVLEAEVGR